MRDNLKAVWAEVSTLSQTFSKKSCFQNKSKFITEEYFSKHIKIKTK